MTFQKFEDFTRDYVQKSEKNFVQKVFLKGKMNILKPHPFGMFEVITGSGLLQICSIVCSVWTQDLAQLEFLVIPREVLGIMVTRQLENFLRLAGH